MDEVNLYKDADCMPRIHGRKPSPEAVEYGEREPGQLERSFVLEKCT